jgi:hypothetical protein
MKNVKTVLIQSFDSVPNSYNPMWEEGRKFWDAIGYAELATAVSEVVRIMKEEGYCLNKEKGIEGIECCEIRDEKINPNMGTSIIWRKLNFIPIVQVE